MSTLSELSLPRLTRFAFRNVLRHRRRSLLTGLIAWFCVLALSLFQGYIQSTKEVWGEILVHNEYGHLQVFHEGYSESDDSAYEHMITAEDTRRALDIIRRDPLVQFASPRVRVSGLVGNGKTSKIFVGSARDPAELDGMYLQNPVTVGEFVSDEVPNGIVLGCKLAERLHVKLKDELLVLGTSTMGSMEAINGTLLGTSKTGNEQLDGMSIYLRLADVKDLILTDDVHNIVVLLKDGDSMAEAKLALARKLRAQKLPLVVRDFRETAKFFGQVIAMYATYFAVSSVALSLLVFFSISNSMYMSITDRTREFAIMKTVGLSRGMILATVLLEGAILVLAALVLGMSASYALHYSIDHAHFTLPPPPGGEDCIPLDVVFRWSNNLSICVMFIAVGIVSSVLPAVYVVRADIIRGLKSI